MSHALVVGGTGMMGGVSCWLVGQGMTVSVVARRPHLPCVINPLAVDYRHTDTLQTAMKGAIAEQGAIDRAVCWIHGSAPDAPDAVAAVLDQQAIPVQYVHVLGSAGADPDNWQDGETAAFSQYENLSYQRVVLGFVAMGNGSRWLTHREISDGVIGAIQSRDAVTIVGQIRPWAMRP